MAPPSHDTPPGRHIMKIDGHCHCGAIAYEADVEPDTVTICHCSDCQMMSGSAYRANIMVPADKFKVTRGTPKTYLRTADSGNVRMQAFCTECGTQLWACSPQNTPNYSLRTGTITQRAQLKPKRQIWRHSALPWVDNLTGLPGSDKQG